ncbi:MULTISPECIES: hypothetical protein [Xanthomonas]|uniref:Uncharacterized protein n=2 Tax=Xanthomonas TaxID=338 RepID=A0A7Z7J280_XANCH|nr:MULTISPECIES: hypothetical protein [Xanthomonas]ATS37583.1 hypothetical protein XcfCFBP6988P_05175 [Xanthomonas citri pv. phaseoli var. fuscans]ATS43605.1 hypothetical protein XcfCFBP6989P_15290 [Xanthomonas citri pv. phaseoli var. fuscans]ATS45585.1 hypothetical protein XcfCFBP6990P_02050 [Xanthomonas citri pv. phaseoli var. fuscans]ATS84148.1 hypothetical protein XcfCFBP6991P_09405 [Xanthomonas citri pv. phaseoli var. fuscans]QWN19254.1 hypothetical protein DGM98_03055 [Xanthomonas citri]
MGTEPASERVVLGIHSNGGQGGLTDGHAWITVKRGDSPTEYYGLWPDNHPMVKDNGADTDIRSGMEKGQRSDADRYYELSPAQTQALNQALRENVTWELNNNCSSWASETVSRVTGRQIDAGTWLPTVETPNALIGTIRELESRYPTSPSTPEVNEPAREGRSSNSLGQNDSSQERSNPPTNAMTDPGHAGNRLFAGLREGLPEHISDERVAFAAQRAHEAGITDMSKVSRLIERDGDVFVAGTTPGFRASVLASEQPPTIDHSSAALARHAAAQPSMEPDAQAVSPRMT